MVLRGGGFVTAHQNVTKRLNIVAVNNKKQGNMEVWGTGGGKNSEAL